MNVKADQLKWVEALKAFAIIAILFNHFIECFDLYPWFSNPSSEWPNLNYRLQHIFPNLDSFFKELLVFIGWLGDMGPGVFILLSGFTLAYSNLKKNETKIDVKKFYIKRYFRIIPLYFTIHILILIIAVLLGKLEVDMFSPTVIASLSGFRFLDSLFFFLNPSWWFIWLIFQLYLVFPLLYKYLLKLKIQHFILLTLLITLLSRMLGLADIMYSNSLYYWMTGLFFGTRLIEFSIGMALAKVFIEQGDFIKDLSKLKLLAGSLFVYAAGFTSSLFLATTLISNLLITLGMSGLFLFIWKIFERSNISFQKIILWVGKASFAVFLLHQPLMIWFADSIPWLNKPTTLIIIIVLSFPLAYYIELGVNNSFKWINQQLTFFDSKSFRRILILSIFAQLFIGLLYSYSESETLRKASILFSFVVIILLVLFLYFRHSDRNTRFYQIGILVLLSSFLFSIVLTSDWLNAYWIYLLIAVILLLICRIFLRHFIWVTLISVGFTTIIFIVSDISFRKNSPIETGSWGEISALQKDSTTVYSLIPNKKTHLQYNNYDYYVNTNSYGFNSPEIDNLNKDSNEFRIFVVGDAFSMPEGMEYQFAYPFLLEKKLNSIPDNNHIQVINGGVTGYGPNEMLACIQKNIDILQPDMIINQVFINELDEIHIDAERRLESIGLNASFRRNLFGSCQIPYQLRNIIRKLNANSTSNYNYSKSLVNLYEKNSDYYSDVTINKIDTYFSNIKRLCDSADCKLLVMFVAGQLSVSSPKDVAHYPQDLDLTDMNVYDLNMANTIFGSICNKKEIYFIDPTQVLKESKQQPVYYTESWHWNEEGHEVVAGFLSDKILKILKGN